MVDVEKELGPLFDKLDAQKKLREEESQKYVQELHAQYTEFNGLVDTTIYPVMRDYQIYLQKRSIMADISREPRPGLQSLPSIKFSMMDTNILSGGTYPSLKFGPIEGSIRVITEGKKPSANRHSKDQINQDFVKSKLTDLIKSCYDA